jgi:hypothetical protein
MLHRVSFVLGLGAAWLLIVNTNAACAQSVGPDPRSSPIVAVTSRGAPDFERGLTALQAGDQPAAIAAFRASYDLDPNPAALLNLGIAYTNLGKPHDAAQMLTSYLEHADAARDASSIRTVRAEIVRLRSENGVIQLHMLPDVARVQVDGEDVSPSNGELLVVPGKRSFLVSAEGYLPFNQSLDVQPGRFTLEVQLKSVAAVSAASAAISQPTELVSPGSPEPVDEPEAPAAAGCAMSELCVGPVVALLGPPNLIGGGLHLRFGRYLGAGVDYQALPSINISSITVGASLLSANARVYPFGGAFFVGGGFGYQTIKGQLRDGDMTVGAKTGFPAATANIGFMGHDGFVLGADIGLLFPLGSSQVSMQDLSGNNFPPGSASQTQLNSVMSQAQNRISHLLDVMPVFMQVNLLRVGYLF